MKMILLIHVVLACMLYSCRGVSTDSVRALIPGTYGRFSDHEFGKEYDTLVISVSDVPDVFTITRRWRYERLRDKGIFEPEYTISTSTAQYLPRLKALRDQHSGDTYSFISDAVFIGTTKYKKL